MRITSENFLKRDLIGHASIIKATVAIGEGDCAGAAKPTSDLRYPFRIRDHASGCHNQIIINVFALQRSQATRPAGDIGEGGAFRRDGQRRLLCNINPVFGRARTVP